MTFSKVHQFFLYVSSLLSPLMIWQCFSVLRAALTVLRPTSFVDVLPSAHKVDFSFFCTYQFNKDDFSFYDGLHIVVAVQFSLHCSIKLTVHWFIFFSYNFCSCTYSKRSFLLLPLLWVVFLTCCLFSVTLTF